jgi:hypothetical protein
MVRCTAADRLVQDMRLVAGAVLLSCACSGQPPRTALTNASQPTHHRSFRIPTKAFADFVAIDESSLVWVDHELSVFRSSLAAPQAEILGRLPTSPRAVRLDRGALYVCDESGVARIDLDKKVTRLGGAAGCRDVVVGSDRVYWTDDTGPVRSATLSGTQSTTIASASGTASRLALGPNDLFIADGTGLQRVPTAGGAATRVTARSDASSFAVVGSYLFSFTTEGPGTYSLAKTPIDGGPPTILAEGLANVFIESSDSNWIYVASTKDVGATLSLEMFPTNGGTPRTLVPPQARVQGFAVGVTHVAWSAAEPNEIRALAR